MTAPPLKYCASLVAGLSVAFVVTVARAAMPAQDMATPYAGPVGATDPSPSSPSNGTADQGTSGAPANSTAANVEVKIEAALASPPHVVERASGSALWLVGIEHTNRRPARAGITDGYDFVIHSAWLNHRNHIIGKQDLNLALGASSGGFDFDFAWMTGFGAGLTTFERGLIYVQGGFETYYRGNQRVHTGLVAPLFAVGHVWTGPTGQLDLGARVDVPLLGGIELTGASTRLRRHPDIGGYASARVGPIWLSAEAQQRELELDNINILQLHGSLCAGRFLVVCTRVHEHWMTPTDRHITEVALSVGLGSLSYTP